MDAMTWIAVISLLITALGAWFGYKALRKRKPDTSNSAVGSKRVTQTGGSGKTSNTATDSEDVDQSGA